LKFRKSGTKESNEEEEPNSPITVHVCPSDQNSIRLLQAYWRHHHASGSPIKDWNTVTQEEFDEFQTDPDTTLKLWKLHGWQVLLLSKSWTQHHAVLLHHANLLWLKCFDVASSMISRSFLR
jgi:hypothetical protein